MGTGRTKDAFDLNRWIDHLDHIAETGVKGRPARKLPFPRPDSMLLRRALGARPERTALCDLILVTEAVLREPDLNGSSLTAHAFDIGLFGFGQYIVGVGLILFAFSTLISWSYYGDRCAEYLFGEKAVKWYRYLYLVLTVVGAVGGLRLIWNLADIFNALMAIPNLIGLIVLAGLVTAKKKDYIKRLKASRGI